MMYCQVTSAERYTLGLLRQRGLRPAMIARVMGRHRSAIGRELRRNRSHSDGTYRPQLADWYANGRRRRSRRNTQFTATEWARIDALVREDWSPEQIAGRLRLQGLLHISHESIYRRIWRDKRRAEPSIAICAARRSSSGSATAPAIAADDSPESGRSRRGRRAPRSDLALVTGRVIRCWAQGRPGRAFSP